MDQQLIVTTTVPLIKSNFETIKGELEATLHTYNIILTADTVSDGKTAAAQLNKMKQAIKTKEKEALETIMGPVSGFKDQVKELITLVDDTRDKITEQVAIYEEKTKDEIREQLKAYRDQRLDAEELYEPFRTIEIEDLVLLGSRTKTGNLVKKVMETINGRISENKTQQMQHEKEEEEKRLAYEARVAAEVAQRAEENRLEEERKAKAAADAEVARRAEEIRAQERERLQKEQAEQPISQRPAQPSRPTPYADTPETRKTAQGEINEEIEQHEMQQPETQAEPKVTLIKTVSVYLELRIDTQGAPAAAVEEYIRKQWLPTAAPELAAEVERIGVTQPNGEIRWHTKS